MGSSSSRERARALVLWLLMIGSLVTGSTSVGAGAGSVATAGGDCPPAPGLFITDGASLRTGRESVLTAGAPDPCGPTPPPIPPLNPASGFTVEFLLYTDALANQIFPIIACEAPPGGPNPDPNASSPGFLIDQHNDNPFFEAAFGVGYAGGNSGYLFGPTDWRGGSFQQNLALNPPGVDLGPGAVHAWAVRRRITSGVNERVECFKDGVLAATPGLPTFLNGILLIARKCRLGTNYAALRFFTGMIAGVRILNLTLSNGAIATNAAALLGGGLLPVVAGATVALWQLQGDLLDSSGQRLDMTMERGAAGYAAIGTPGGVQGLALNGSSNTVSPASLLYNCEQIP